MTITLVGYRGTGKSSVAQQLAEQSNLSMLDADAEIERRAGCTIRDIFAKQGEAGFRELERDVMSDLLQRGNLVIAAGGGAVLNADTRSQMKAAGPVVWLQADPDTIESRLRSDTTTHDRRPPLTKGDLASEIATLLAAREPLYREVATVTVVTDHRDVAEIVAEIISRLNAPEARR